MNKDVKAQWITALNSGEFTQGTGHLKVIYQDGSTRHCCLGVLCELAVRAGIISHSIRAGIISHSIPESDPGYGGIYSFSNGPQQSVYDLPYEVVQWADLDFSDPLLGDFKATTWNDSKRKTFSEIAAMIEVYL